MNKYMLSHASHPQLDQVVWRTCNLDKITSEEKPETFIALKTANSSRCLYTTVIWSMSLDNVFSNWSLRPLLHSDYWHKWWKGAIPQQAWKKHSPVEWLNKKWEVEVKTVWIQMRLQDRQEPMLQDSHVQPCERVYCGLQSAILGSHIAVNIV